MKILIVDDDINISNILSIALKNEGYDIEVCNNSIKSKDLIATSNYDLIILDIMMPNINGYDLCKHARYFTDAPIIFITCLDDEESLITALKLGGDDYIKKPFNLSEVIMRVKVHLRRTTKTKNLPKKQIYKTSNWTFYYGKNTVTYKNEKIHLSPLESDLLKYLFDNSNKVLTYKNIYENIWNESYLNDKSTIMARISNLRNKITNLDIETIRGIGYKLIY